jgi:nicotinamide phosphoribosyltransferase
MISYVESRGGKFDNTVFLWFTNFLKTYLEGIAITTTEDVSEAQDYLGNEKVFFGRNDVLIEPNLIIS